MKRLLLAALGSLLLGAAPAAGAEPVRTYMPSDLNGRATSSDALVHFRVSGEGAITQAQADRVASVAQSAHDTYVGLGFPEPLDDGDGRMDLYVFPGLTSGSTPVRGIAKPDRGTTEGRSSSIGLDSEVALGTSETTIRHEYFHTVQHGITIDLPSWLAESTANWAAARTEVPSLAFYLKHRSPLDCTGENFSEACESDARGYRRWVFFEGMDPAVILDTFRRSAALSAAQGGEHGFDALVPALTARGLSLGAQFAALGVQMATGTFPKAESATLPTVDATLAPAAGSEPTATTQLALDHASLAFVGITSRPGPCRTVPLILDAQPPAEGSLVFAQRGGVTQPLSGTTEVPWKTCSAARGYVVLVNGSATADALPFAVSGRLAPGPELSALTAPRKVRLRKGKPGRLAISVSSTAAGTVLVRLGSLRKTFPLIAGTNRLGLRLPATMKAGKATLRLTPTGAEQVGATLSRAVTIKRRR